MNQAFTVQPDGSAIWWGATVPEGLQFDGAVAEREITAEDMDKLRAGYTLVISGDSYSLVVDSGALDQRRAAAQQTIIDITHDYREQLKGDADSYEVDGWPVKAARARRIDGGIGTAEDSAAFSIEAALRGKGETESEVVGKALARDAAFATAVHGFDGIKERYMNLAAEADLLSLLTLPDEYEQQLQGLLP